MTIYRTCAEPAKHERGLLATLGPEGFRYYLMVGDGKAIEVRPPKVEGFRECREHGAVRVP